MRNLKTNSLLFELSKPGRRAARLPACDVPAPPAEKLLPPAAISDQPPPLPEVAEPEVVRHFTNLSTLNMSVDTHFYPLGSCTMKYNSKRNERMAALPGIADLHPLQSEDTIQGLLQLLFEVRGRTIERGGLLFTSLNQLRIHRAAYRRKPRGELLDDLQIQLAARLLQLNGEFSELFRQSLIERLQPLRDLTRLRRCSWR